MLRRHHEQQQRAAVKAGGEASGAEPEPSALPALEAGNAPEARHPAKRVVRISCLRVKRQDPDNGIYKWHIDAIRAAGLIHDDTEEAIELITRQIKVATKAEEKTIIEIT